MPIDLRSDTVTQPTDEMRRAMAEAPVGDDVYGEDPTVRRLEELGASMVGKEAALFVPSGTMGNQVAILTHTRRGDEIIVDANSHIFMYEVAAAAVLSAVQVRIVNGVRGEMALPDIEGAIRGVDIHSPVTRLLCLENTHNRAGGTVVGPDAMDAMAGVAHARGVRVHLDGARIFNAAIALGVPASRLCRDCDSVMFCLSKGLSAPVGSLLAGDREFIEKARKNRKMLGGGMRQAGILAASGLLALERMVDRLAEDHNNARRLAQGLVAIPGLSVDLGTVQTNIVVVDVSGTGMDPEAFAAALGKQGVLSVPFGALSIRMVTHKDIRGEDIDPAIQAVHDVVGA